MIRLQTVHCNVDWKHKIYRQDLSIMMDKFPIFIVVISFDLISSSELNSGVRFRYLRNIANKYQHYLAVCFVSFSLFSSLLSFKFVYYNSNIFFFTCDDGKEGAPATELSMQNNTQKYLCWAYALSAISQWIINRINHL